MSVRAPSRPVTQTLAQLPPAQQQRQPQPFPSPPRNARDADLADLQKLYLFSQENRRYYKINERFLEEVQDAAPGPETRKIKRQHRSDLVEWLYEISRHYFRANSEAFQLAVNLVDRVCSQRPLLLGQYQALGAACFMIASKSVETRSPGCTELEELAAGAFSSESLKGMELWVLGVLEWLLNPPTPNMFLELYLEIFPIPTAMKETLFVKADQWLNALQKDYHFVRYKPSVQAAAALKCSFQWHKIDGFNELLCHELNSRSLETAALVSNVSIPRMNEILACTQAVTAILGWQDPVNLMECTRRSAERERQAAYDAQCRKQQLLQQQQQQREASHHTTRVRHGLATPVKARTTHTTNNTRTHTNNNNHTTHTSSDMDEDEETEPEDEDAMDDSDNDSHGSPRPGDLDYEYYVPTEDDDRYDEYMDALAVRALLDPKYDELAAAAAGRGAQGGMREPSSPFS
ncbi:uncharacterized protein EV422DRAFT_569814 [Fimicolochytrium jonesii]|uniref:uncharacterized protein n=1 Tax=Fimicolochytrium jonesii TaxID=1396493 RepID=UPI0022FE604F|nr:uncharacterized protein EV422DRAFT_569814 [Fimicolochytrium jonesii]KAI8818391.1 hypothetical protein EV422DRAFT_569814 [Fimicolochytrium jonesii]